MNEKFAPELLESKADLVECMLDQIKEMASLEFQCNLHSPHDPLHPPPLHQALSPHPTEKTKSVEPHTLYTLKEKTSIVSAKKCKQRYV